MRVLTLAEMELVAGGHGCSKKKPAVKNSSCGTSHGKHSGKQSCHSKSSSSGGGCGTPVTTVPVPTPQQG
jgi:hypothetical protein